MYVIVGIFRILSNLCSQSDTSSVFSEVINYSFSGNKIFGYCIKTILGVKPFSLGFRWCRFSKNFGFGCDPQEFSIDGIDHSFLLFFFP